MFNFRNIKSQFSNWDKKKSLSIGNSREYKIIGCGKKAFKVLVFEPQPELNGKPGWSQKFWPYDQIKPNCDSYKVISKLESQMGF